jgi:flavin-binding protein dodecin
LCDLNEATAEAINRNKKTTQNTEWFFYGLKGQGLLI